MRAVIYVWMLFLGVLHALTFEIWGVSWLAGAVQILILSLVWAAVAKSHTKSRPALLMFVFAMAWFVSGLYWLHYSMHDIGGLPVALSALAIVALSAYLSIYYALVAWLWRRYFTGHDLWRYLIAMPILWMLAELGRGYVFGGFPWLTSAYAQVNNGAFKGFFPLVGTYGVSALLAVCAGALAYVWGGLRERAAFSFTRRDAYALCVLVAIAVLGVFTQKAQWVQPVAAPVSVRLVQPNVPQSIKFEGDEIIRVTNEAIRQSVQSDAQLTVFPETVMPFPWSQLPEQNVMALHDALAQSKLNGNNRAVLIGGVGVEGANYFNSALWLDANQDITNPVRYDKIHLLPFGEMIPWGFQWFVDAMDIPLGGYAYGQSRAPFVLQTAQGPIRVAANICYENVFGEELALWHRNGQAPNIWVNMTNLGWFGDARTSPAHEQFLVMSQARALELGRPMLLATNTGISAQIAPNGDILNALAPQQEAVGNWQVQPYAGQTPFSTWRNAPLFAVLFLGLIGEFLRLLVSARKNKPVQKSM